MTFLTNRGLSQGFGTASALNLYNTVDRFISATSIEFDTLQANLTISPELSDQINSLYSASTVSALLLGVTTTLAVHYALKDKKQQEKQLEFNRIGLNK